MNKDIFYIDDLASIRAFCISSDKEDVYKYIYSLQQENKHLKDLQKNMINNMPIEEVLKLKDKRR